MSRRRATFDPVPDPGLSSAWRKVEPPRYCGGFFGALAAAIVLAAGAVLVVLVIR